MSKKPAVTIRPLDFEIGALEPRLDVAIGDRIEVRYAEVRRIGEAEYAHFPVISTIVVDSVDDFTGHRWCRGIVVETTSSEPERQLGRPLGAHMGTLD